MREVWKRYGLPIGLTEVHISCTSEEQVRWLSDAHGAVRQGLREGLDLRAVTAWSLLSSIDWNSLLVQRAGFYEPGAFDVRCMERSQSFLAKAIAAFAQSGEFDHPVLDTPGWWRRTHKHQTAPARRLLIAGADEMSGALMAACELRGI